MAAGTDPSDTRKEAKNEQKVKLQAARRIEAGEPAKDSFEEIAREWLEQRRSSVEPAQRVKTLARMENDVFPWLGHKPITQISAPDVLSVLRRLDDRGARYSAHRVKSEISLAFRYAIANGRAERDPCPDLKGAIPAPKAENFPAITDPQGVAALLRAIDAFRGAFVVTAGSGAVRSPW